MDEFPSVKEDAMSLCNNVTKALKKARIKIKSIDPRTFRKKRQIDEIEEAMMVLKKM